MSAVAPVPPREWTVPPSDVLLADGSIAVIRTLRPEDRQPLLDLHAGVSEDTLRLRFFTASRDAARRYVEHLFDETNADSAAMVAVVRGRVAGLATAEVADGERAEVAFLVSDEDHGRGLGILLLEHLAALGRAHGLTRFEAEVLGHNYGMLRVFRGAGFAVSRRTADGEVSVELRTDVSAAALDAADRREWRSEARSLRPLLAPASVAVVGVRRHGGGLGRAVLDAIRSGGYAGRLSVVHPEADAVDGVPAYASVSAVPDPVDLVVVVVPADQVPDVMTDACAAGVGAAVVVSSGLTGGGQTAAGRDLLALCRAHSVRLVGPNSQGVIALGRRCPQRVVRPYVAGAGRAGRGHPVRRGRVHRPRPGARPGGRRALVRLAGGQARRVQQRPARRVGRGRDGDGRGAVPRVVRQRAEVRADRSPVRRAQAAARRGRGTVRSAAASASPRCSRRPA